MFKQFYDCKRQEYLDVSLHLMIVNYRLLDQSACTMSPKALESHFYRFLVKWDMAWRRGMHMAQSIRHDNVIMKDFRCIFIWEHRLTGLIFVFLMLMKTGLCL
jgi:hypothetical protein